MIKAALYNFSKWYVSNDNKISLHNINIGYDFQLVDFKEADFIIVLYGGNADHIPYIEYLLENYTNKTFLFIIGEYLRRNQPMIPKKISTKAMVTRWGKKLFPYTYLPSHILFPYPKLAADKALFLLLYKYRNNDRVHSLLCEDAPELGRYAFNHPIFIRNIIKNFIPDNILYDFNATHSNRYRSLLSSLKEYRPVPIANKSISDNKCKNHSLPQNIFCGTVFGNTTKERIIACNMIKKYTKIPVEIYGHNPISNHGKLLDSVHRIYQDCNFVLCFENISASGYITEKLSDVIIAQAIPIYWGASNIDTYCNSKSMLYCRNLKDIRITAKALASKQKILSKIYEQRYFLDMHIDYLANQYEIMKEHILKIINNTIL